MAGDLIPLPHADEITGLRARKITDETCRHFHYFTAAYKGKTVQVAPYFNADGKLVAEKVRTKDKDFRLLGDLKDALPFGAQCWPKTGRMIVVTEGEIDALSMSQVQGNQWPVVSIGCGAGAQTRKYIAQHRDYFRGFEKVILMFDMDAPGREAAKIAAEIIGPSAHIADFPEGNKDANDMLKAGKTKELLAAMWNAKQYRPDGIVTLADVKEKAREKPREGLSFPWDGMTAFTNGIQQPYLYAIGAGAGTGKTDVCRELARHLCVEHGQGVGMFLLEEEPQVTAIGIASKIAKRQLNTPDGYDADAFEQAWQAMQSGGPLRFYDSFGINEWDSIAEKIEYLVHVEGLRYFIVDHLTALIATADDERRELDRIMAEMSGMITRLGITIFVVSHLTTPDGKPHEEGGRVTLRHFTGSRAIARWAFGAVGLERDQQSEDDMARHTTTVRCLKARGFGWNVGHCMYLRYDPLSGTLTETDKPPDGTRHGFRNETTAHHTDGASDNGSPSDF